MWSIFENSKPYAAGLSFEKVMDQIQVFSDNLIIEKENLRDQIVDFLVDDELER